MKYLITESQYNLLISEQTSTSNGCKIWVDSKNDPKYIKYVNALNLYMRGKSIVDFFKSNPNATNVILNKKEVELEKKYPVNNKYLGFGTDSISAINMILVGKGSAARNAPQYPKPNKVCIKQTTTKTPPLTKTLPLTKTPPIINYKELKSETTFAPQYKSGTPVVQVGTYFMTYPEFEAYKKERPNTKFNKI